MQPRRQWSKTKIEKAERSTEIYPTLKLLPLDPSSRDNLSIDLQLADRASSSRGTLHWYISIKCPFLQRATALLNLKVQRDALISRP